MLTEIARFEARYVLRNPLLWVAAAAAFALMFAGASVDGFDLGNEGGLLKNASYAILRNYVILSVFYMFVTTAFVANAVLRDDETGYGPIIRSTGITRLEYVCGRFLGAFGTAAACLLIPAIAMLLGSLMPWAPADQIGPTRIAVHLYAYFVVALPNLFIHAAILFALVTLTRSMMAAYLAVVGFIGSFMMMDSGFAGNAAVAIGQPFGSRALKNAVRYWTVPERNVNLPDISGELLYNRLLWVGIAIVSVIVAISAYRFADQGMSKRERKRMKVAQPLSAEVPRTIQSVSLPSPDYTGRSMRALLWMRTRFEARQVILNPAFPLLLLWGLFTTFYALTSRDEILRFLRYRCRHLGETERERQFEQHHPTVRLMEQTCRMRNFRRQHPPGCP
jgi:ABC-type transport system involved in multi-copper enzyme maturation permease subunit